MAISTFHNFIIIFVDTFNLAVATFLMKRFFFLFFFFHYENYTDIFKVVKNENFQRIFFVIYIFLIFAQNIDCGFTLEPPRSVLTSTHNLWFGAKIRKNRYTPAYSSFTI